MELLSELAQLHQERGDNLAAIGAFRLVADDPTHEGARVSLMRLHASARQGWRAIQEYAQLRTALRDELDVDPCAATQDLYADIVAGRLAATEKTHAAPTRLTAVDR